jgi:hypothetical protein
MRILIAAALVGMAALTGAQGKPPLSDILKAAGTYLSEFSQKVAVIAEEDYVQRDTTTSSAPRRLQSDVVLVGLGNGVVIGHRYVHTVDSSKVRERDERLLKLFTGQNPAAGQEPAKKLEEEVEHYYLSPNLRTLDAPGLALEFLREANQPQSTFSIESIKNMDGAQVAIVKFVERPTSKILPTPDGAQTSGKFWIDVANGAVRQTELTVDLREVFRFHVASKFANDATVGFWVPSEVLQDVDIKTATKNAHSNMGAGGQLGSRRTFEGRARYSKYRRIGS